MDKESKETLKTSPTAYIMTGRPYAGKSTLTNALVNRFAFKPITLDEINTEFGIPANTGDVITEDQWQRSYGEAYRRVGEYLTQGDSIIFDAASFTKAQRDKIRQLATEVGCPAQVIYVDTPELVCRERWQQNKNAGTRSDVREDDFAEVVNNFQVPGIEEEPLEFHYQEDIPQWLENNKDYFNNSANE